MKYKIFNKIINSLVTNKKTYVSGFKDYNHVCYSICDVACKAGHPFAEIDGFTYIYTGTHLEKLTDNEVSTFLKFAYQKLSGDKEQSCRKDLLKGMIDQFPYTVLNLNIQQAKNKINFSNGTLNLTTLKLEPFNYQDYFRYVLPYNYDSKAKCPKFSKYLEEVMPESEAREVLAEYIAWLFTKELKLEKVLFLYGAGCNGKSVFIDIVEALLGKDNISHESLSDMCSENGGNSRANLDGKLLNTCSDVAPNAFAGDVFKRIASQEPISAKILYKDVRTLTDYAKMMFCLNELPKTNDHSNGFYRRFLIAPFNVQIPKNKINPNLAKEIIATELPGIMNWVLLGRERLVRNKAFTESPIMKKTLEEYKSKGGVKKRISLLLPPMFR